MMRKILVLFTMIALTTCWVSCSDNEDEEIPSVEEDTPADNSQEDTVIYKVIMEAEISDATPVKIEVKGKGNKKANLKIEWGDNQTSSDLFIIEKEHQYRKVGLYTITLTGNDITSLSISGPFTSLNTSQCPCMKELSIASSNLISIDVTKNTQLTSLSCYNNQLNSLDISNNHELRVLGCDGNQLTSLDISNNHELRSLSCSGNQLTSLDISSNHELRVLGCDGNQLTSLDISNNIELQYLSCKNNLLMSLDISNNQNLSSLLCEFNNLTLLNTTNAIKLETLACSHNQLTTMNFTSNIKLRDVYIAGNSFSSESLNSVFYSLPLVYNGIAQIEVDNNIQCDKSIATRRGWRVFDY